MLANAKLCCWAYFWDVNTYSTEAVICFVIWLWDESFTEDFVWLAGMGKPGYFPPLNEWMYMSNSHGVLPPLHPLPPDCVLSPLLFPLSTNEFTSQHSSSSMPTIPPLLHSSRTQWHPVLQKVGCEMVRQQQPLTQYNKNNGNGSRLQEDDDNEHQGTSPYTCLPP